MKSLYAFVGFGLFFPAIVLGRPVDLSGNAEIRTTHNSNIFKQKINTVSETITHASPSLTLSSPGRDNTFTLNYSPTYSLNHRRDEYTLDQEVDVFFEKNVSSKFKFELKNQFDLNDNPSPEVITATALKDQFVQLSSSKQKDIVRILFPELTWNTPDGLFHASIPGAMSFVQAEIQTRYNNAPSARQAEVDNIINVQTISRELFWTNTSSLNAEYKYFKDCKLSFGYDFTKRKNDTNNQSESDSHSPHLEIDHRFYEELSALIVYDYTATNYSMSDNSKIHYSSIKMTYQFDHANALAGEYGNRNTNYGGTQSDQNKHTFSLDFDHSVNDTLSLKISANPYTIDNDTTNDERGYGFGVTMTKIIKRGQVYAECDWRASEEQTTNGWKDLRESWTIDTGVDYQLSQFLTTSASFSYGERQNWAGLARSDYYDYGANLDMSYQFNKWLQMAMEYDFSRVDSDNTIADDYYNNQVMLKVSASNSLLHW